MWDRLVFNWTGILRVRQHNNMLRRDRRYCCLRTLLCRCLPLHSLPNGASDGTAHCSTDPSPNTGPDSVSDSAAHTPPDSCTNSSSYSRANTSAHATAHGDSRTNDMGALGNTNPPSYLHPDAAAHDHAN